MFLEDVGKRVDIRYFNNYDKMDKALKQNIESLPKIINDNLVQVRIKVLFLIYFNIFLG